MNKTIYYWLDILSAINVNDRILTIWIHNKDIFFNNYMVINDEDFLIIGDKKNKKIYEYKKTHKNFKIEFEPTVPEVIEEQENNEKLLFKFKNIELIKR